MNAQHFDISKIHKKIKLLTFGYIRDYISNKHKDIEIPKNIILLFACFANIYIDSRILKDYSEIYTFIQLISNEITDANINECNLELIYRSSRDGDNSRCFWDKCKSKTDIVLLIQNNNDHMFGCYLSIGLCNIARTDWFYDKKCFIYQIKPQKIVYKHAVNKYSTQLSGLGTCFMVRWLWRCD